MYKWPKLLFYELERDLVFNAAFLNVTVPALVEFGGLVAAFAQTKASAVKDSDGLGSTFSKLRLNVGFVLIGLSPIFIVCDG